MSRNKAFIIFLSFIGLGLGVFFLINAGYYPVVYVGGDFVSAKQFNKNYGAVSFSYSNLSKTYSTGEEGSDDLSPLDLQVIVLEQLINNALIKEAAREEVGKDLDALVQSKIQNANRDPALRTAAQALYGYSATDLQDEVLIPQATAEVLRGRLYLKGTAWDEWLTAAREDAHVVVFSKKFYWDDAQVKVRNGE